MTAPGCRACGSKRVVSRGRKRGGFLRHEFEFYSCQDCELLFVEPFSGFEIYNDAYYRGDGPDPFVDYATEYRDWRATDRGFEFDDLARLAEGRLRGEETKRPKDQGTKGPTNQDNETLSWLDFGCGAGGFLKYLRERETLAGRPLALTGHDVGSYAALLQMQDNFRILDLDGLSREADARFDIISMIEVIEHLPHPGLAMALIARLLKPGGLLLLTTGNLDSPVARRHGIHYRYCAPEIHVSLFNPRALASLYRRHGLEPYPVRYQGAVKFKALKSLRHRPLLRAGARLALGLPITVRALDALYGVSAMPCAVKPKSGSVPVSCIL